MTRSSPVSGTRNQVIRKLWDLIRIPSAFFSDKAETQWVRYDSLRLPDRGFFFVPNDPLLIIWNQFQRSLNVWGTSIEQLQLWFGEESTKFGVERWYEPICRRSPVPGTRNQVIGEVMGFDLDSLRIFLKQGWNTMGLVRQPAVAWRGLVFFPQWSVSDIPQTVFSCRGSYGVGKVALKCTSPHRWSMMSHFACNLHGLVTPTLKNTWGNWQKKGILHFSWEVYQLLPPRPPGAAWVLPGCLLVPPSSVMRPG